MNDLQTLGAKKTLIKLGIVSEEALAEYAKLSEILDIAAEYGKIREATNESLNDIIIQFGNDVLSAIQDEEEREKR